MAQAKALNPEIITFIAAVLLILLFGYTAFSKLLEYDKFIFQMHGWLLRL